MAIKLRIKGWKTALAGILSITWGIGGWVTGVHDFNEAMNYLISGFSILGVGHKLDKLREESETTTGENEVDTSSIEDTTCRCCCKCCKK